MYLSRSLKKNDEKRLLLRDLVKDKFYIFAVNLKLYKSLAQSFGRI